MKKLIIGVFTISSLILIGVYSTSEDGKVEINSDSTTKKGHRQLPKTLDGNTSSSLGSNGEVVAIPAGHNSTVNNNQQARKTKPTKFKSIQSNKELKKVRKELTSLFKLPIHKIKHKISLIKIKQDQIKEWKYIDGQALNKLEVIKPEYAITMAIILKKSIGKIIEEKSSTFKLELSDLYAIQTFSESKDFNILLSQNRLNSTEINLKRLKEIYSNEIEKSYFDDGRIEGIPSSEPSLVQEDLDNET